MRFLYGVFFFFFSVFALGEGHLSSYSVLAITELAAKPNPDFGAGPSIAMTLAVSAALCQKVALLNLKHHVKGDWAQLNGQLAPLKSAALSLMDKDQRDFKTYLLVSRSVTASKESKANASLALQQNARSLEVLGRSITDIALREERESKPFFGEDAKVASLLAHACVVAVSDLV